MEAKELRQFGVDELKGRVRQWREELFRSRFKGQASEARDTSTYKKLKQDIARALTILSEKGRSGDVAPAVQKQVDKPSEKKVIKAASKEKMTEGKKVSKAKATKKNKDLKSKASDHVE